MVFLPDPRHHNLFHTNAHLGMIFSQQTIEVSQSIQLEANISVSPALDADILVMPVLDADIVGCLDNP